MKQGPVPATQGQNHQSWKRPKESARRKKLSSRLHGESKISEPTNLSPQLTVPQPLHPFPLTPKTLSTRSSLLLPLSLPCSTISSVPTPSPSHDVAPTTQHAKLGVCAKRFRSFHFFFTFFAKSGACAPRFQNSAPNQGFFPLLE